MFLIAHFRRVLNVVFFLLCDSPTTEFYVQTFRNPLLTPPMKMEQVVTSETSVHQIQRRGNHQKERIHY